VAAAAQQLGVTSEQLSAATAALAALLPTGAAGGGAGTTPAAADLASLASALTAGALGAGANPAGSHSAFEQDGPKEERIIEVPARKKGHLLGLHGQTIEKIRQTSGVIKCHIQADRTQNDKTGSISVQIFGIRERVEVCADLVQRVVAGDHSGIGHATDVVFVDTAKVGRLRGDRWQVINALKDLTKCYLDILQGPEAGVPPGEAQLFMAGPPDCVDRARTIISSLLNVMDHVPASGEISTEVMEKVLAQINPAGGPQPALTNGPAWGGPAQQPPAHHPPVASYGAGANSPTSKEVLLTLAQQSAQAALAASGGGPHRGGYDAQSQATQAAYGAQAATGSYGAPAPVDYGSQYAHAQYATPAAPPAYGAQQPPAGYAAQPPASYGEHYATDPYAAYATQQPAPGGYNTQPVAGGYAAPQAYPGYQGYAPQQPPTAYAAQPAHGGYAI